MTCRDPEATSSQFWHDHLGRQPYTTIVNPVGVGSRARTPAIGSLSYRPLTYVWWVSGEIHYVKSTPMHHALHRVLETHRIDFVVARDEKWWSWTSPSLASRLSKYPP